MEYGPKIKSLTETTKKVFKDCVFPGGAIVAANSFQTYFPKDAKNYKFVWPRDGAFICHAANLLDMNISMDFFNWCMKAEGWEQKGIYYEKYFISGKQAESNFQPDQTGALLWELCSQMEHNAEMAKKLERLVVKSADGISKIWNKDHFCQVTQDLWEERLCFPDMKENFIYSLAAVQKGLTKAYQLLGNEKWLNKAEEMQQVIIECLSNGIGRSFGKINDERIDASLLGLIWPFDVNGLPEDIIMAIINKIEKTIVTNYSVYRYEHDEYDGWMYNKNIHRRKGAGYWPLLNFWMSIAHKKLGNKEEAEKYFYKVIDDVKVNFIAEQIFNNPHQVSVSPLCWSHAMFVIAAKELELL